jgi:hypothetical protein
VKNDANSANASTKVMRVYENKKLGKSNNEFNTRRVTVESAVTDALVTQSDASTTESATVKRVNVFTDSSELSLPVAPEKSVEVKPEI